MALFNIFRRKKETVASQLDNTLKKPIKKMVLYPQKVESAFLKYCYVIEIQPIAENSIQDVLGDCEKIVEVTSEGDTIFFEYKGNRFASAIDATKAKMVADYIRKDDPVHAILLASGDKVNLRFYRDLRKTAGNREQTVVTLTAYKSKAAQEAIECCEVGDELEIDDSLDRAKVCGRGGDPIGTLPTKENKKFNEEGIYAIYLESLDVDDNLLTVPQVRIYW